MEKQEITCIGCPMGCALTAEIDGENVQIFGSACKIGVDYGVNECLNPRRMVTASVKVSMPDGSVKMLSLKTVPEIPKNRIFDCLKEIKKADVQPDIKIGDVVIKNILGLGSDIVATRNILL